MSVPGDCSVQPTADEVRSIQLVLLCGSVPAAAARFPASVQTIEAHIQDLQAKSGLLYIHQIVGWLYLKGYLKGALPPPLPLAMRGDYPSIDEELAESLRIADTRYERPSDPESGSGNPEKLLQSN